MDRKEVRVVSDFGREWERFDQGNLDKEELEQLFNNYFKIFPWEKLPEGAVGFDLGCGSGRWAKLVAPRVGQLHLIDPSDAIEIARKNLAGFSNCVFHRASVDEIPLEDESCDFGYSLGVLHHISDTQTGLKNCVSKLKKGALFCFIYTIALIISRSGIAPSGKQAIILEKLSAKCRRF
jgi:ubiquinone/menaquinone biosynthesis C-methylase UbiE